jgi:xylan 1,4-beta-xylosidase
LPLKEVIELDGTNNFQSQINLKFITISVPNDKNNLQHAHKEIELVYVIKGSLRVNVSDKIVQMKSSDFIIINSNEFHSFQSEEDDLFILIHFNYSELSSLLAQNILLFSCNSTEHTYPYDQKLRFAIEQLLTVYINQSNDSQVVFFEKVFKLISILELNYLQHIDKLNLEGYKPTKGANDRLTDILNYIHSNYHDPLTLDEVARVHFISVPYLSKIFKKQTGKTFSKYLNEIRLAHAVNELTNSNKSMTRIALDNGFPTITAFNRSFNEKYDIKPGEYRRNMVVKEETEKNEDFSNENNNNKEMSESLLELRKYLHSKELVKELTVPENRDEIRSVVTIKSENTDSILKYWNKVINIGLAKDLLNSAMQEQIHLMQSDIGFTYARIWGLLSEDMQVENRFGESISYHFAITNHLLDFLIKNKLKPFIEFGPKPKLISKTVGQAIFVENASERSLEDWKKLIRAFLLHCSERYGIEEVETWYFEIWRKPPAMQNEGDFFDNLKKNNLQHASHFKEYFNEFSEFKKVIKEIVPMAKVGGCGLSIDLEGDKFDLLLEQWKLEEIQPDFLSVYLYPIEINQDKTSIKNLQSTNTNYIKNKLIQVRKTLKKTGFKDLELNVTEWNISVSNRNYLHDSCFKAAYLIRNITEIINQNQVNMLGYWLFSDISSDFRDTKHLLHGGAGLVTKSGIKKPSYHAFVLLKQLGNILVAKGDHYIVTKKSGDRYQVLCFNYKHFNYSYYLQPEGSTGIYEQYDIFENKDPLNITLEIQGINNGKYRVKEFRLNRHHGSVLDEWLEFGAVDEMMADEVSYLRKICVPNMKVEFASVENQSIVLKGELEPHEVRLFELNLFLGDK